MNWSEEIEKIVSDEIIPAVRMSHGIPERTVVGWNWVLPSTQDGYSPQVHLRIFRDLCFGQSVEFEIAACVETKDGRFFTDRLVWAKYFRAENERMSRRMAVALIMEYLLDAKLLAEELAVSK